LRRSGACEVRSRAKKPVKARRSSRVAQSAGGRSGSRRARGAFASGEAAASRSGLSAARPKRYDTSLGSVGLGGSEALAPHRVVVIRAQGDDCVLDKVSGVPPVGAARRLRAAGGAGACPHEAGRAARLAGSDPPRCGAASAAALPSADGRTRAAAPSSLPR